MIAGAPTSPTTSRLSSRSTVQSALSGSSTRRSARPVLAQASSAASWPCRPVLGERRLVRCTPKRKGGRSPLFVPTLRVDQGSMSPNSKLRTSVLLERAGEMYLRQRVAVQEQVGRGRQDAYLLAAGARGRGQRRGAGGAGHRSVAHVERSRRVDVVRVRLRDAIHRVAAPGETLSSHGDGAREGEVRACRCVPKAGRLPRNGQRVVPDRDVGADNVVRTNRECHGDSDRR